MKSTREKYLHPLWLENREIPNNLWLAPLAGYSHIPMRKLCRRFGAGFTVTEMVSIEGMIRNDRKTQKYAELEHPLTSIQLFGKGEPEKFREAALQCKTLYNADFVDINFGCPVKKVIRNGAGSALLTDPEMMRDIVSAVKDAGVIVTAKIRIGFDQNDLQRIIPVLSQARPAAIILHARTAKQVFSGQADWGMIRQARDLWDGILIANGDINTPEDAERAFEVTQADGIMLGRGAVGKPYLFGQIVDYFETGRYHSYTQPEIAELMREFAELYIADTGQDRITGIRSHLIQFVKGIRDCKKTRFGLSRCNTLDELSDVLNEWLSGGVSD